MSVKYRPYPDGKVLRTFPIEKTLLSLLRGAAHYEVLIKKTSVNRVNRAQLRYKLSFKEIQACTVFNVYQNIYFSIMFAYVPHESKFWGRHSFTSTSPSTKVSRCATCKMFTSNKGYKILRKVQKTVRETEGGKESTS